MGRLAELLKDSPIIAAVREGDYSSLLNACNSKAQVIFMLGGQMLELEGMVAEARECGKFVMLHIDLCEGLRRDEAAVDYCACRMRPDGIISTHSQVISYASEVGLETVQRMFLMDSQSFKSGVSMLENSDCDVVEVMPGLVPKAISFLSAALKVPVIAGGMITTRAEVEQALRSGAMAVSTSCEDLWFVDGRELTKT